MDLQFFIDTLPKPSVQLSDEGWALLRDSAILAATAAAAGFALVSQQKAPLSRIDTSVRSMHPVVWRVRQLWAVLSALLCVMALAASRSWLADFHLCFGFVLALIAAVCDSTTMLMFEYLVGAAWVVASTELVLEIQGRSIVMWLKAIRLLASSLLFVSFLVRNPQLKKLQTLTLSAAQLPAVLALQGLAYVGCLLTDRGSLVARVLETRYTTWAAFALVHVLYKVLFTFMSAQSGITIRARPGQRSGNRDNDNDGNVDAGGIPADLPSDSVEISEADAIRLVEGRMRSTRHGKAA
jgi:hypothetical protein